MNWQTLREAIRDAVVAATGLPDTDVVWQGTREATGWHSWPNATGLPPAIAELSLRQLGAMGWDEVRKTYSDSPSPNRTVALVGNRRLQLAVRIESQRQDDGQDAVGALSGLLRTRVYRPSILAALHAAGLAVATVRDTIERDFVDDQDRTISVGITEILIFAAENDSDAPETGEGWIDAARVASEDGAEVELDVIAPDGAEDPTP